MESSVDDIHGNQIGLRRHDDGQDNQAEKKLSTLELITCKTVVAAVLQV